MTDAATATMSRVSSQWLFLRLCSLLLVPSLSHSQESCLGPGFTQTIPPVRQWSQYSTTVLQPGNRAIYTTLSFRCNGTLESLTIPSQVRGSDYPIVDNYLEPRPSIWRFTGTGYRFLFESTHRQRTSTNDFIRLNSRDVRSYSFTVMLQRAIQAGDVLGFQLLVRGSRGQIEHLPLLYKPGPTPGSFTPIIIASFNPTSPPPTESSTDPSPSGPPPSECPTEPSTSGPPPSESSTEPSTSGPPPSESPTELSTSGPPPSESSTELSASGPSEATPDTSTGTLNSSGTEVTHPSTNCSSEAEVLNSLFHSPFVAAGITAAAVQLEVLLAILVTAIIVCRCRGMAKRNNPSGFVKTSTNQINPVNTRNNLPAAACGHGPHEYETLTRQFQTQYPNTRNGGNGQNVEEDAPIEEYYETGKLPKTESTGYSYI